MDSARLRLAARRPDGLLAAMDSARLRLARWLLLAAGVAVPALLLERTRIPWAWIGFLWAALLFSAAWLGQSSRVRLALVYLACVPLAVGTAELQLGLRTRPRADPAMPPEARIRDDVVGLRPAPNVAYREALWQGEKLIFDVVYTIDGNGQRVTPPSRGDGDSLCVLFFGCSFTFGTGVRDDETSPWLTGVATGYRHHIYNFSFAGWGPHQMLAALQSGQVDRVLGCQPTHVIYQGDYDHLRRVAGRSEYDPHGPRFVLAEDGRLVRAGNFDDTPTLLGSWPSLGKSETLRILSQRFTPGPRDFDLFAEVVKASRDLLVSRYPGVHFHALLWNKRRAWKQETGYFESLQRRGIQVHFATDAIPDLGEHVQRYAVSPYDGHPNRAANERIAAYVAREILGEEPRPLRGDPARADPAPASATAPSRAASPWAEARRRSRRGSRRRRSRGGRGRRSRAGSHRSRRRRRARRPAVPRRARPRSRSASRRTGSGAGPARRRAGTPCRAGRARSRRPCASPPGTRGSARQPRGSVRSRSRSARPGGCAAASPPGPCRSRAGAPPRRGLVQSTPGGASRSASRSRWRGRAPSRAHSFMPRRRIIFWSDWRGMPRLSAARVLLPVTSIACWIMRRLSASTAVPSESPRVSGSSGTVAGAPPRRCSESTSAGSVSASAAG